MSQWEDPQEVNLVHSLSDVDSDDSSQHHTLGTGPTQAAKGTHAHDGVYVKPADLAPYETSAHASATYQTKTPKATYTATLTKSNYLAKNPGTSNSYQPSNTVPLSLTNFQYTFGSATTSDQEWEFWWSFRVKSLIAGWGFGSLFIDGSRVDKLAEFPDTVGTYYLEGSRRLLVPTGTTVIIPKIAFTTAGSANSFQMFSTSVASWEQITYAIS